MMGGVDMSSMRLRFAVADTESVALKTGQTIAFRVKAFGGREFKAALFHVDATANPATRMVDCLATIDAEGAMLKPGFFAQVSVEISKSGALVVEGTPVHWDHLERELALRLPKAAQKTLLVQADRSVPVEKVVVVLDAAKKLGVGKLGIGVVPTSAP